MVLLNVLGELPRAKVYTKVHNKAVLQLCTPLYSTLLSFVKECTLIVGLVCCYNNFIHSSYDRNYCNSACHSQVVL